MSNANTPRNNIGFQYRLRFFHKCRAPGTNCDPGQLDRCQVQGSAIESTCGAPVIVVLVRYRHDPESGLSRECQRAQFAPGAVSFAVKAIVVPADQVLSYMDQPLLQQPRLLDSQGRNIIGGPDVSSDGCIYATPLEKNGIAHLNNFCLLHAYNGQPEAAASRSSMGMGQQQLQLQPSTGHRVRAMLGKAGSDGGGLGMGACLGSGSEVLVRRDSDSDALSSGGGELCLLVQLLRRDVQRPGRWYAYDMPHLISRPFQVLPRSAMPALHFSGCTSWQQPQGQLPREPILAPSRGLSTPRHSAGHGLDSVVVVGGMGVRSEQLPVQPQPFMSPQYKRHGTVVGCGAVLTAALTAYSAGPGLPNRMGVMGAGLQPLECSLAFPGPGAQPPMTSVGMGAGMGVGAGAGRGVMLAAGFPVLPPVAVGGGAAASGGGGGAAAACGGGFMGDRGGGGGGGQSSLSCESPTATCSQRGSRARRRSCLSKDTSHEDSSVGAPLTTTTSGGTTAVAALRTPSITSGMDPGGLRTTTSLPAVAALTTVTVTTAAGVELGWAAAAGAATPTAAAAAAAVSSPPFSPPSRLIQSGGLGGPLALGRKSSPRGPAEDGRPSLVHLPLRQTSSATLMDMNISDLLKDIHPQPLLAAEDMMDLEEEAPKRVRSNAAAATAATPNSTSTPLSDVAGFVSDSHSHLAHNHPGQRGFVGCSGGDGGGGGAAMGFEGALVSRADSWSAEMCGEQLRKQSTCLSGNHAASFAAANGSTSVACSGSHLDYLPGGLGSTDFAAGTAGGTGGEVSRGSSASQLDLLFQLLGQPAAMQEAMDRMDRERQQQEVQQAYGAVAQAQTSGGGDSMQV